MTDPCPADETWADPAWQVDSTVHNCCNGIGRHARGCTDVAAPAGATAEEWCDLDYPQPYRAVRGDEHRVDNVALVYAYGIQYPDGRIDVDDDRPTVRVDVLTDEGLTSDQARQLATAITAAARTIDGWVRR